MANEIKSVSFFFFPFVNMKAGFNYIFGFILISYIKMIYLNWVEQKLFYYNSASCLCNTEISVCHFPKCNDEIAPAWYSMLCMVLI